MTARRKPTRAKQLGVTDQEYARLFAEQRGVCAICGGTPKRLKKDGTPYALQADHDHRTGAVRGLLCHRCNRALPNWIGIKWLHSAAVYLRDAERELGQP